MGSETDETTLEEELNDILDLKEINDEEYDIPEVAPPSLERVLWDLESEEGSDTTSLHSLQTMTVKFRSLLFHCVLQGLSSQIKSAGDRVQAGLPTVITNSVKYVAVGTSHGYILNFDSEQKLCWCCHDLSITDQGAISALAYNLDSTRLLVGYERGYILMLDVSNGDIIRRLPDAHAPQSAVLHLRFTYVNGLALCGDSSGCVFSLSFNRRLGVRTWDSKCLFSGARGEVCVFEPLVQGQEPHFLNQHILVAMATMSKVIVISIRPRLKVLFSQALPRVPTLLPLLAWQLVSVGKNFQPVLAWGRGTELNYTRVITHGMNSNKIRLSSLRSVNLSHPLTALHWLGSRHLALLDVSENLRLVEVRTQRELEVLDLSTAGLVYGSAHFKALAVGGGVSEAFALAGERACYSSLSSRGDQLLVLGTKAVHMVKLRTWPERLLYLCEQGKWTEALNIAADEGLHRDGFTTQLFEMYLANLNQNVVDKESLTAAINCCVKLKKIDLLCTELHDAISMDQHNQDLYYTLISDHICNGTLQTLTPAITQSLVDHLKSDRPQTLENVILSLDLRCLDLHQVLSICRRQNLYDAWIHVTTKTIGDYTSPLTEFLPSLTPDGHKLGNTMLVYVSSCFAGLGYPSGKIPEKDVARVKHDMLRCLETVHSINCAENEQTYPYLRALLKYNTRECLNVVELAFREEEFWGDMGLQQRHRLIQILTQIVVEPEFSDGQIISLCCFTTRLVTSNNLNIEETLLRTIVNSLTSKKRLSVRDHIEREQSWLDLLHCNRLTWYTSDELLRLALESNCFRVAERLYNFEGNYANILTCYLNDPVRKSEVFSYVLKHISESERCVKEQFLVHFKELLAVDTVRTVEIVTEHFSELVNEFCAIVGDDSDLQYKLLGELVARDVKLPSETAENYLELLALKNKQSVYNFLQLGMCRTDEALAITEKHHIHDALAYLLEQRGDWTEALDLLLAENMLQDALNLCIRGSEHLDDAGSQRLWLKLLQNKTKSDGMSSRQLLHAAAPHVPPSQLLDLVSDVSLGDTKALLYGMLADCVYDVHVLEVTLRVLGKDLHQNLAKALALNGRGVCVRSPVCGLCEKPLAGVQFLEAEQSAMVFGCGHCFHSSCVPSKEDVAACPQCKATVKAAPLEMCGQQRTELKEVEGKSRRPDVEGHF